MPKYFAEDDDDDRMLFRKRSLGALAKLIVANDLNARSNSRTVHSTKKVKYRYTSYILLRMDFENRTVNLHPLHFIFV